MNMSYLFAMIGSVMVALGFILMESDVNDEAYIGGAIISISGYTFLIASIM